MRYAIISVSALAAMSVACGSDHQTKSLCVKGDTRTCVGPGQCQGAQFCASDGSAWSDCDCGTSSSSGGASTTGGSSSSSQSTPVGGKTAITSGVGGTNNIGGGAGGTSSSVGGLTSAGGSAVGGIAGITGGTASTSISGSTGVGGTIGSGTGKAGGSTSTGGVASSTGGSTAASGGATTSADAGDGGQSDNSCFGPGDNYCWNVFTSNGWPPDVCSACTASWVTLDDTQARVVATSTGNGTVAGMNFTFGIPATVKDLSSYSSMTVAADVASGQAFQIGVATLDGRQSCSWSLTGKGAGQQYQIPLQDPDGCWPKCVFDLKTASVSFETPWSAPSAVDLRVNSVSFEPISGAPQTVATSSAGPNGWCWYTWQNPSSTAAWVVSPSSSTARAYLTTTSTTDGAGIGFSFPTSDLTRFDRIVFKATASTNFDFDMSRSDSTAGCKSDFTGSGTEQTYTFNFADCSPWRSDTSKPVFSFSSVTGMTWRTIYGITSQLDIQVVPDILFCKGTQCTDNPLQ